MMWNVDICKCLISILAHKVCKMICSSFFHDMCCKVWFIVFYPGVEGLLPVIFCAFAGRMFELALVM